MRRRYKYAVMTIVVIILAVVLVRISGLTHYLSFGYLKSSSIHFKKFISGHYWSSVAIFIGSYTLAIIAGFPAVAPFSMLGGFLYGIAAGTLYSVIAGTIGSLITFIIIRYFFSFHLTQRYADKLKKFHKQIHDHGISYLLALHFMSIVPFFVINSLAALTPIGFWTFLWTTIFGTLPLALIYSLAGLQLAHVKSIKDIFSPSIIIMLFLLVLLSLLPIVIKRYKQKMGQEDDQTSV